MNLESRSFLDLRNPRSQGDYLRISRRAFLSSSLSAASVAALGQGIVSHTAHTDPRRKGSGLPFDTRLTNISEQAGLHTTIVYGGATKRDYIVEAIGCGCAFVDYDNDGWLDLLLLSGTTFDNEVTPPASNRLYHNNRDGTFSDVTREAGLYRSGWAYGVCVGDIDNDGYEDIFITYWGENVLYRNNGNGTFTDITKDSLPTQQHLRWGTGCTFVDYNRDGHLDLFVSNYLVFDKDTAPRPGAMNTCRFSGIPVNCGPHGYPLGSHSLYRNNGAGVFTDVSLEAGISEHKSYGLTAVAADFDDDGWPDIYVACDSTPSLLFINQHDGTFRECGALSGTAYNSDGQEQAGMGVAVADVFHTDHLDLLKTHFADDLPILYRNNGHAVFEDATRSSGLAVDNRFVCWGVGLVDLDNDGNLDLFVTTGHVYLEVERDLPKYPAKSPCLLFRGLAGGQFEELFPGSSFPNEAYNSRGCAFGDFDNDGDMDIIVVNLNQRPSLLRNDRSGPHHWIKVKLIGRISNRSGIGARVTVTTLNARQVQERMSQSSFLSSNDPRLHFGLGSAHRADVHVRWPSGKVQTFSKQGVDQLLTIDEERGIIANLGWS